jgi:hypothetical protein
VSESRVHVFEGLFSVFTFVPEEKEKVSGDCDVRVCGKTMERLTQTFVVETLSLGPHVSVGRFTQDRSLSRESVLLVTDPLIVLLRLSVEEYNTLPEG